MKIFWRVCGAVLGLMVVGTIALKLGWIGHPWGTFERTTLNPGYRSAATPGELGLAFQHVTIPSGPRKLDAFFVPAAASCVKPAAVLVFHGRGETIAEWTQAQQHFHEACIASLTFDYSGHGRSDGPGTIASLNADGVNSYQRFLELTPGMRHCLFSHSMGGGPMLWTAVHVKEVDCVVVASPFSSLTSIAERGGLPKAVGVLLPDAWDNAGVVAKVSAPILWIHSHSDQTIPFEEGKRVFEKAQSPKYAVAIEGFGHNAVYKDFPPVIWEPMIAFIRDGSAPDSAH